MIRIRFGLAFIVPLVSCATPSADDRILRIHIENSLRSTQGEGLSSEDNQVVLKGYSYPSALKFYTEPEILRILRLTCDKHASRVEVTKPDDKSASIAWNFTQNGKGKGGTTQLGLARFGATLTEVESDVLAIRCGERVY